MAKRLVYLALVGEAWISGCTGLPASKPVYTVYSQLSEEIVKTGSPAANQQAEVVYLLLAAEIAGQRGQYEAALDNYLKVIRLTQDVQVAERATQIALYLKNTDRALEAVSVWIERDPKNVAARRILAMLLLKSGQTEKAVEELKYLLTLSNIDLENTLIELVKWLSSEISREEGLKMMESLTRQFPRMAELHFAYALLASNKGEHQLALKETEQALALHPDWNRARLLRAQVMSQMGDSTAARDALQRALKSEPDNARLRLIYSQFLAKTGDRKGAERELLKILGQEPENHDARFGLAALLMEVGQVDKARQEFLRLAQVDKWRFQAFFYLGLIDARKDRLAAALEWFDKIDAGDLEFDARVNAVTALINLGRMTEARQRLNEVRHRFPHEALRLYLLEAELLSKIKDYDGAFELLSDALEELPGQVELLYSRALVAGQLDRIEVVEADLRAVLEKNPDDHNALNALGYTLVERSDRLDEAKKYLDRAIELKPDDPAILDSYGWLQYRLGHPEVALKYLRRAYDLVRDVEIGAHLGEVLWESGHRQQAKKIWREAMRKDPDQKDIQEIKVRYREAFK